MGGRADQLDAAVMRLGVGIGNLEAGQETVVDVDDQAQKRPSETV
jgi:hypothetical protein